MNCKHDKYFKINYKESGRFFYCHKVYCKLHFSARNISLQISWL